MSMSTDPTATSDEPLYDLHIIGDPTTRRQGNCPICLGTTLYLREKGVPVRIGRVCDEKMEDPFFREACGDTPIKMPILRSLSPPHSYCGTAQIFSFIEYHHPYPSTRDLGRPDGNISPSISLGQIAPGMSHDVVMASLKKIMDPGVREE
ncbi:hypothetical protein HK102_004875, partial [Quaeritorhiza haematococci]